jgi:7-carboxy-7-deazaguanine synthase
MSQEIFLTEIFSAIQGEGSFVGCRQVFVRTAGCNLRCRYCDQPESLELRPGTCRVETVPGSRVFDDVSSPLPLPFALEAVDTLMKALPHHSVSVTGGEPLMQSQRLVPLLGELKARGHRIHLETSGVLHRGLERVLDLVDAISMDIKLSSADGQNVDLEVHRRFLEVARRRAGEVDISVKAVVATGTTPEEVAAAASLLAPLKPPVELFLQPVTPFGPVEASPSPAHLLALQEAALFVHSAVRVVPQTHKLIGQL